MTPESFAARVQKTATCWYWMGRRNDQGYGMLQTSEHRHVYAHRYAYELANGPIPSRACVLHSCDVRRCVNPAHLSLGTRRQNSAEMVARGRSQRGENHSQAVLTDAQVEAIRALYRTGWTRRRLAETFGITASGVGAIVTGRRRAA